MIYLILFLFILNLASSCQINNCALCDQNNQCIDCNPNYYLYQNECNLCDQDNMYKQRIGKRICTVCDENCFLCKSSSTCFPHACNEGYVYQNGNCIKVQSEKCVSNCKKCIDELNCGECEITFFLYNGKCTKCTNQGCSIIWWDSLTCSGKDCLKVCGHQQYEDGNSNCRNCHSSCKECVGETDRDCIKCPKGSKRYEYTCVSKCPDGSVYNIINNICEKCSNIHCKVCQRKGERQCLECKSTFTLDNGDCLCSKNQFLHSSLQNCIECNSKCQSCYGPNANQCLSCQSDQILINSQCYQKCPQGEYLNTYTFACEKCHELAEQCTGPLEKDITKCLNDMIKYNLKCICPLKKYYDSQSKSCIDCHISCNTCQGSNEDQCLSCDQNLLQLEKKCVKQCPEKYYLDSKIYTCLPCYQSCQTCSGPLKNQCSSCKLNFQTQANGECTLRPNLCQSNQYYDIDNQICKTCSPQCARCSGPSSLQCLGCISGFFLRNSQCISIQNNTKICNGKVCDIQACQDCNQCDVFSNCLDLCTKDNCKIENNCRCPTLDIPGNLALNQTPQFMMLTIDDGIIDSQWDQMQLKNKILDDQNLTDDLGCHLKFTYYTMTDDVVNYTYVPYLNRIGEIALHTSTHNTNSKVSRANWQGELFYNKQYLQNLSGLNEQLVIKGARAPYLAFNNDWFKELRSQGIEYDSSTMYITLLKNGKKHRYWPHTLDFGTVFENYCQGLPCKTEGHSNIWEIPLQVIYNTTHSYASTMDPQISTQQEYDYMMQVYKDNFIENYNANRAPFGLYVHPQWFFNQRAHQFIKEFFSWVKSNFNNIIFATESEILEWVKSPRNFSDITNMNKFKCRNLEENYCKKKLNCPDARWGTKTFCTDQCIVYDGSQRCWDQICNSKYENETNCPLDCMVSKNKQAREELSLQNDINNQKQESTSKTFIKEYQYILIVSIICVTLIILFGMKIYANIKQNQNIYKNVQSQSFHINTQKSPYFEHGKKDNLDKIMFQQIEDKFQKNEEQINMKE